MEKLLNGHQIANYLGISYQYLARMRIEGRGPKFYKLGESAQSGVRYKLSEVDTWLESQNEINDRSVVGKIA